MAQQIRTEIEPGYGKVDLGLGALHESEQRLLIAIRKKYRFGELKILTRHGLPYRLKVTERFEDLNSDSNDDLAK